MPVGISPSPNAACVVNTYAARTGAACDGAAARGRGLIANIDLIADPDRNFAVIMKDGRVEKSIP
jgi:hypothetical protein